MAATPWSCLNHPTSPPSRWTSAEVIQPPYIRGTPSCSAWPVNDGALTGRIWDLEMNSRPRRMPLKLNRFVGVPGGETWSRRHAEPNPPRLTRTFLICLPTTRRRKTAEMSAPSKK